MLLSLILNCAIVLMVAFGLVTRLLRWDFMKTNEPMEGKGAAIFRFFTTDSNIFAALASLIMAVSEAAVLRGRAEALSPAVCIIKFAATSSVTLTFMVTVCFLTSQVEKPLSLFHNSGLFFHLLVPIAAIISFVFTENGGALPFGVTVCGALPAVIYGFYYMARVLTHLTDGKPDREYDFYNFLNGKKERVPAAMAVVFLASYVFSVLLWLGNTSFFGR